MKTECRRYIDNDVKLRLKVTNNSAKSELEVPVYCGAVVLLYDSFPPYETETFLYPKGRFSLLLIQFTLQQTMPIL